MRAIIVDDSKEFAEALEHGLLESGGVGAIQSTRLADIKHGTKGDDGENKPVLISKVLEMDPSKISDEIKASLKDDANPILINIEGRFNGARHQDQKGVDVLLWLRCNHRIPNPAILYSFQANNDLLKKRPDHLIINSEGCYYLQLPNDLMLLRTMLQEPLPRLEDWERLRRYLRPAIDLERFRHEGANWWGVKCLWDMHSYIINIPQKERTDRFPYPQGVKDSLSHLDNAVASFLYEQAELHLGNALQLRQYGRSLQKAINDMRTELFQVRPKILHIDDKAAEGWAEIFQYMLYGTEVADTFRPLPFDASFSSSDKIDEKINGILLNLIKTLAPTVEGPGFFPDVILLDARLLPRYDAGFANDVEKMSGYLLLTKIRGAYPGIPVIITTASNKMWTFEELMKIGADGYWIKEGLDERRTPEESVKNYSRLLDIVVRSTREEYQNLNKISRRIDELWRKHGNARSFWWQNQDWNFEYNLKVDDTIHPIIPRVTTADRETVRAVLTDSLSMMRQYYHSTLMGYGYNTYSKKPWYLPSQAVLHLSNIIEIIHDFTQIRKNVNDIKGKLKHRSYADRVTIQGHREKNRMRRQDTAGGLLYIVRNRAAHYPTAQELTHDGLITFFNDVLSYLENRPVVGPTLIQRFENSGRVYADRECKNLIDER